MKRPIVGFHRDAEGQWVAELACGHAQHVRHDPPFQNRPWVIREEGRADKLGSDLDCLFCDMPSLPPGLEAYKETRSFDEGSIPAGLLRDHRTKPGVWARIVVERGRLGYTLGEEGWVLRPGVDGIVPPDTPHHVRPLGEVCFRVVFLRTPIER
ncbi:MAG: DUF3565 domain-containing protein [Sandaracinaceae bacterium]